MNHREGFRALRGMTLVALALAGCTRADGERETEEGPGEDAPGAGRSALYSSDIPATPDLSSYWRLGEAPGATSAANEVNTAIGTYRNGVQLGVPGLLTGDSNTAIRLDGVDDEVDVGDRHNRSGASQYSLEAWVVAERFDGAYPRRIMAKELGGSGPSYDGYRFMVYQDGDADPARRRRPACERERDAVREVVVGTTALVAGQRYHLVCTYDGSRLGLLVNGQREASVATSTLLPDTTAPLMLGAAARPGRTWAGTLDELALYDRALTDAEVLAHYQSGTAAYTVHTVKPANGAVVSGRVPWACDTSDDANTQKVEFFVDGVLRFTEVTPPYEPVLNGLPAWDSTQVADGTHALRCLATRKDGATAAHSVTVTVRNSVSCTATYFADCFEDSPGLSQWVQEEAAPDRLVTTTTVARHGRRALQALVHDNDFPSGTSGERAELATWGGRLTFHEGDERWFGWSTLFPIGFPYTSDWGSFLQWKNSGCGPGPSGSPPIHMGFQGEKLGMHHYSRVTGQRTNLASVTLQRGVWHDWVVHVKFHPSASVGYVEYWHNGVLLQPRKYLSTMHTDTCGTLPNYLKVGQYRSAAYEGAHIIYHDSVKVGASYAEVAP